MRAIALFFLCMAMVCSATSATAQEQQPEREPTEEEVVEALPPLLRAAAKGQVDEVRRLLKEGANVEERVAFYSPLIIACAFGHLDVIKVLLDAGADPNGVAGLSHPMALITPLHVAMIRRNKKRLETIDMLIAAGAKVNTHVALQSPLDNAVTNRDIEMVKAFLDRGADVDWPDEFGRTTLWRAVRDDKGPDVRIVKLLLEAGANPNKSRIWVGNHCVSILEELNMALRTHKDQARLETSRLLIQHGAKRYRRRAGVGGCYPSR
ncbi:MAG TPA: ankyrin repeat domain-containing protein [Pyrinomonadaceae bacterium]|nr:ankyrin repeat domain-containing protein [Pyrinomonadaceae bacterium]